MDLFTMIRDMIESKVDTQGYVVAGWGGNTYYAYVGKGKGFEDGNLLPQSINPEVFETCDKAKHRVARGIYVNGAGETIALEVLPAREYFSNLLELSNKAEAQVFETLK